MSAFDLIVRGGTIANHAGEGKGDVGVRGGRIVAIGDLATASAGEVIDAKGLHVLPGVIDTQVHFREPGNTHKEDLETGTRAAALGGVTAVFEMPNTAPPTTTAEALAEKLTRARGRAHVDHAFYVGATEENAEQLGDLERLPGCCGVKTFMGSSTGTLLVKDDEGLNRVLKNIRRRAAFHAEDEARLNERKPLARPVPQGRLSPGRPLPPRTRSPPTPPRPIGEVQTELGAATTHGTLYLIRRSVSGRSSGYGPGTFPTPMYPFATSAIQLCDVLSGASTPLSTAPRIDSSETQTQRRPLESDVCDPA